MKLVLVRAMVLMDRSSTIAVFQQQIAQPCQSLLLWESLDQRQQGLLQIDWFAAHLVQEQAAEKYQA
jgi:hypothetical protein